MQVLPWLNGATLGGCPPGVALFPLGRNKSGTFSAERQVGKIVPEKMLYTETWLWKQGYHAKQRWDR